MDTYRWLLALHMSSTFFLLGGGVLAASFSVAAARSVSPREIAFFLSLVRVAVPAVALGALGTLVFGLLLVAESGYSLTETWIGVSIVLWVVGVVAGQLGGLRDRATRLLAEQLAAEGAQSPTEELRARMRDPLSRVLSWGSGGVMLIVLALMIWKPGA